MPRPVKQIIFIIEAKPEHRVYVPSSRVPRLKYHGIEPEHIVGLEIDVYLPTGERSDQGHRMKYSHTIFPKSTKGPGKNAV